MYEDYIKYIEHILSTNDITNFKRNEKYNDILEHVNHLYGLEYLKCIETETDIRNISYFSKNMHGHYFASFEASNDLYYYGWKNHK